MSDFYLVRRGSTAISNKVVHSELSNLALALLIRMLAMQPGARMGYRELLGHGDGERRVRTALRELEEAGMRWRVVVADAAGQLKTVTITYDAPVAADIALADAASASELTGRRIVGLAKRTEENPSSKTPSQTDADVIKASARQGQIPKTDNCDADVTDTGKTPSQTDADVTVASENRSIGLSRHVSLKRYPRDLKIPNQTKRGRRRGG